MQWDVLRNNSGLPGELTNLESWYDNAVALGLTLELALTNYSCSTCSLPEKTEYYTRELEALHRTFPAISVFEAWNEPNHAGSSYETPVAAAHFENADYSFCTTHSCTAVAGDFLDESNMVKYEEEYEPNLNPSDPGGNWGIHPYANVEYEGKSNTVEQFKNHLPNPSTDHVWFTEVGAYNCFRGEARGLAEQEKNVKYLVNHLVPAFAPLHVFYYQVAWPYDEKPPCNSEVIDTALYAAEGTNGAVHARPAASVIFGPEGAPGASTGAPSGVEEEQATMNGSANPEGLDDAKAYFQYGPTTSYGSSTSEANVGPGLNWIGYGATFTQLHPGTTLHYRMVVKSSAGTSYGGDQVFTTPGYPTTVFYNGLGDTLQENWWTGTSWGYINITAPIAPGSSVATDLFPNSGQYDEYFRANNGELQEDYYVGEGGWHLIPLGHGLAADTTPSIRHPQIGGSTVLYYTGSSGTLQESWYEGGTWNYINITAPIGAGSSPAADPHPNAGQDDVYFRAPSGELQEDYYVGEGGWHLIGLGHALAEGTTPTIRHPEVGGSTVLFYTGSSGTLQESWWDGSTWQYTNITAPIGAGSNPVADPHPNPGDDDVYFRGSNGELEEDFYTPGEWHLLGLGHAMAAGTTPTIVHPHVGGNTYVFYVGSNGILQESWWNGSIWQWASLGATVVPGTSPSGL